jgi:hypothetical protein
MYTKKTFLDCKQSLADRHDSGILPTSSATLSFWGRLLNRGVVYCADRLRLAKPVSLTTVSGTIALPNDFLVINKVFKGEVPLAQIAQDDNEFKNGLVYWISGNHFDGFFLNTTEDETYTVEYSFKPSEMTADGDICIIPDPEAVVAYAYAMLRKSETDPIGDADATLAECDTRLAEIIDAQDLNNAFTGFTTQD